MSEKKVLPMKPDIPTEPVEAPAPDPLAEARAMIEAEKAERGARCNARLDALLKEERCELIVAMLPAGDGLCRGVVVLKPGE